MPLALLALLPGFVLAAPPYEPPSVTVKEDGERRHVRVRVSPREGASIPTRPVPFTLEPHVLTVEVDGKVVRESDLGGSGFAFDLNGDGDTDDALPVRCDGGQVEVGGTRLAPIGLPEMAYRGKDGAPKPRRLGAEGAHAVLYSPCGTSTPTTVGLSKAPIELRTVPGPALQVMVLQPGGPESKPKFTVKSVRVDGAPAEGVVRATIHDYEQFFGPAPSWMVMRWLMIPLGDAKPHTVTLEVVGEASLLVTAVNHAPEEHVRRRGGVKAIPLRAPPK